MAGCIVVAWLAPLPCSGADWVVRRNGFAIRHERRQVIGTITRLYMSADNSSFVDIPTAEIDHFEAVSIESGKNDPASHLHLQSPPRNLERPVDLNEVVRTASGTYRLDPDLVNSVIRQATGFNEHA